MVAESSIRQAQGDEGNTMVYQVALFQENEMNYLI